MAQNWNLALTFVNKKLDGGLNEVLSWFVTDLMVRDLPWQSHFTFVTFKQHICTGFTQSSHLLAKTCSRQSSPSDINQNFAKFHFFTLKQGAFVTLPKKPVCPQWLVFKILQMFEIWQQSHFLVTLKFIISTWSLLPSDIDDAISVYCAILLKIAS